MQEKFDTAANSFQLQKNDDGNVYLVRQGSEPRMVTSFATKNSVYCLDAAEALRTRRPWIDYEGFQAKLVDNIPAVGVSGRVYNHPTQPDETHIDTSAVIAFFLKGGDSIETAYGKKVITEKLMGSAPQAKM